VALNYIVSIAPTSPVGLPLNIKPVTHLKVFLRKTESYLLK